MIFRKGVLLAAVVQTLAQQTHLDVAYNKIITPGLSKYIQDLTAKEGIPGLTLGVVHSGGQVEYGAWGKKDEEGTDMTPEVSPPLIL